MEGQGIHNTVKKFSNVFVGFVGAWMFSALLFDIVPLDFIATLVVMKILNLIDIFIFYFHNLFSYFCCILFHFQFHFHAKRILNGATEEE